MKKKTREKLTYVLAVFMVVVFVLGFMVSIF